VSLSKVTDALLESLPPFGESPVGERITAPIGLHPVVACSIARARTPLLVITATGRLADDFVAALRTWDPGLRCASLPSWETLPHERLSPSLDTMGRRISVLRRLRHGDPGDPLVQPVDVLVASIRAVAQPLIGGIAELPVVRLRVGDSCEPQILAEDLVSMGYERVDLVERRGQVAVRGGIVDVFCPDAEHPIRLEFWGDEVEDIREFAVSDQRSLGSAPDGLSATAVRELLLSDDVRHRAGEIQGAHPQFADMLASIAAGIAVPGMESLAPLLVDGSQNVLDLLGPNGVVLVSQPERVASRSTDMIATASQFAEAAWLDAEPPIELQDAQLRDVTLLRDQAQSASLAWWELSPFTVDDPEVVVIPAREVDSYRGDVTRAVADISTWCAEQRVVTLVAAGHGSVERWTEALMDANVPVDGEPHPGRVLVTTGNIDHGFTLTGDESFSVLTESDVLAQRARTSDMRKMPTRRRRTIDPLTLQPGDFIVHEQHGIGRYVDMVKRTVGGADREYIVVEYAASKRGQPADRLYVPMDQLDLVTRYVGGEAPSVHRLGGSDWQQAKRRARKAVKEITEELVRLYAARQAAPGYQFGPDTPWQAELEDAFEYVETPDQLACIDEVKADMQRTVPMDRLICGDVGYGKTEIAVRAAFKAAQDGKQVAILVPTTLLVQQHLSTFAERYASFPITIAGLSRFTSDTEVKETLNGLAAGSVDVVIGTHRLLTPHVRFKDLGLVIVDEEQRFGVEHKEHLKALRTNVDVLAMSATPIPRTLEMAVTGIREMSVIQTPPEERHPVLTFVGGYDDRQIAAAIGRELLRDGQVFFVHNRVASIDRAARRLQDLVPEARIAVAHGQMNERTLEQIILDFWEGNIDVLVCTTIVESGIDIPNANTLIVDRADTFGLSQLHQLRGRVGRGRERAYAYFMYPPDGSMTQHAHERLATIAQHAELGAGMHIAMKDLELRGAGNLLGGEQSGHIADVGFDLYVRMVGDALAEVKGQPTETLDVKVELPIDAFIPHDYVPHERLRLEAYRRLAAASDDAQVTEVREELQDRYGPIPEPVETLLAVAQFRVQCRAIGLREVVLQGAVIRFAPVELAESATMRVNRLYPGTLLKAATRTLLVPRPREAVLGGQPVRDRALLTWASDVIDAMTGRPRSNATDGDA
jgi:transcription-repair coupling factor (superfamily II helicase)